MSGIFFSRGRLAGASSSFISISFGAVINASVHENFGSTTINGVPASMVQTARTFGQELLQIVAAGAPAYPRRLPLHVLLQKRRRALPGELGARRVEARALVAMEAVPGALVDVDLGLRLLC